MTNQIDEREIQFDHIRASGPGGQNVNKVASAVQLRFDIRSSASLDDQIKMRLIRLAGKHVTEEGVLIIEAKRYRTQEQNRIDALRRLQVLVEKASAPVQIRKPTHPSAIASAARVNKKKHRGEIKRQRSMMIDDWE